MLLLMPTGNTGNKSHISYHSSQRLRCFSSVFWASLTFYHTITTFLLKYVNLKLLAALWDFTLTVKFFQKTPFPASPSANNFPCYAPRGVTNTLETANGAGIFWSESAALFLYPGTIECHFLKHIEYRRVEYHFLKSGGKGKGIWFELFLGVSLWRMLNMHVFEVFSSLWTRLCVEPRARNRERVGRWAGGRGKVFKDPPHGCFLSCSLSGHWFSERNRLHSALVTDVSVKLHKNPRLLPREGKRKKPHCTFKLHFTLNDLITSKVRWSTV